MPLNAETDQDAPLRPHPFAAEDGRISLLVDGGVPTPTTRTIRDEHGSTSYALTGTGCCSGCLPLAGRRGPPCGRAVVGGNRLLGFAFPAPPLIAGPPPALFLRRGF